MNPEKAPFHPSNPSDTLRSCISATWGSQSSISCRLLQFNSNSTFPTADCSLILFSGSTPLMQNQTSPFTENVVLFECSPAPTKWLSSLHRTQVDLLLPAIKSFYCWSKIWMLQYFARKESMMIFMYCLCLVQFSQKMRPQQIWKTRPFLNVVIELWKLDLARLCRALGNFSCAGLVEIEEGELTGQQLNLQSKSVARISFAKEPHVLQVDVVFCTYLQKGKG